MTQMISDRRDIDFVLYEMLDVERLCKTRKYNEFNRKTFDMIITEARLFALREIWPTYVESDREGAVFESGSVTVPSCFHSIFKLLRENGWIAMTEDPEWGGQGLPHIIAQVANEYFIGANYAFMTYAILGRGSGRMIELYGTDKQKELFLKKLYTGVWGGTMLLTEPDAGSDVGALTTTAVKNPDGTYSITGSKIFITNGEQDVTENIIHPVLARVDGAPKGTKGISLFIVPKYWVNDDGSLGGFNDVVCTGIEEKLGIHASPTCALTLGGKGKCRGYLLGEENKGMGIMFHMMNEVRLEVGTQGFCHASTAYLHALDYAAQRIQGRDMADTGNPDARAVPIIRHPDVRRMLLWMKAHVDGMRSLIYYVAYGFDRIASVADNPEREKWDDLISLLTPVVKSYCTDRGFDVTVTAMQVFGGYGYTREFPVEQILRDCKIASIYEGTNGIQAMDLLGRKLGMKKGATFMDLLTRINATADAAARMETLKNMAEAVKSAASRLSETAVMLGSRAMSPDFKAAFSFASPFLEVTGDVVLAWMHLWRALTALPRLEKPAGTRGTDQHRKAAEANRNAAFYEGQIKTAEFFIHTVLPGALGKMDAIMQGNKAAVDMPESAFGL